MNIQKKEAIHFLQSTRGFDIKNAINLILVFAGAKPAGYAPLKITNNYEEKAYFEKHLKKNKMPFCVGKVKGFEEIKEIKGNRIIWRFKGLWYGYDLFSSKKWKKEFDKYLSLLKKQKHNEADTLAGKMYGYPSCCVKNFIKENNLEYLKNKYTSYQFYSKLHKMDRKFSFIFHTPCSLNCSKTKALNEKYKKILKKIAPKIFAQYSEKKSHSIPLIFSSETDLYSNWKTVKGIFFWKKMDGGDYTVITQKLIEGHYILLSHLSKKGFKKGDVYTAKIITQYDYADIKLGRKIKTIKDLHHERKIPTT